MRVLIFLAVLKIVLASECEIPYEVMYAIAKTERHLKREVGYPYLISINRKKDIKKAKRVYGMLFIDNRTIDCLLKEGCIKVARDLIKMGIKNIDLGAFQINYKFYRYPLEDYFDLKKSYKRACSILTRLKNRYGWSWETIGKYHSFKKWRAWKYATEVYKNIYY